jgi:hypothetical protein
MAIRYRTRERRLERTISRIELARRSFAMHVKAASDRDAWWRRHGDTLEGWRRAIAEHHRRQPTSSPAEASEAFRRWASGLRLHPTVLRLHLECWWLTLKLGLRGIGRGPRS